MHAGVAALGGGGQRAVLVPTGGSISIETAKPPERRSAASREGVSTGRGGAAAAIAREQVSPAALVIWTDWTGSSGAPGCNMRTDERMLRM